MDKKEVLKTVKQISVIVVTAGVGAIVGNAVDHVTPANISFLKKTCMGIGALVLAGMASDAAGDYTEQKIDETVEEVKKILADPEEAVEVEIVQEA